MAFSYGGMTRIRFGGTISPMRPHGTPNAKRPIIIRCPAVFALYECRTSAHQHGRATDPHLGGARSGCARPALSRAARGVRAGAVPGPRLLRPRDSDRGGREHGA